MNKSGLKILIFTFFILGNILGISLFSSLSILPGELMEILFSNNWLLKWLFTVILAILSLIGLGCVIYFLYRTIYDGDFIKNKFFSLVGVIFVGFLGPYLLYFAIGFPVTALISTIMYQYLRQN